MCDVQREKRINIKYTREIDNYTSERNSFIEVKSPQRPYVVTATINVLYIYQSECTKHIK